jgi:hypothetical protein
MEPFIVTIVSASKDAYLRVKRLIGNDGDVHQLRADQYPTYQFCSLRCLDVGAAIAGRHGGVIHKTEMEQQAIGRHAHVRRRRAFLAGWIDATRRRLPGGDARREKSLRKG